VIISKIPQGVVDDFLKHGKITLKKTIPGVNRSVNSYTLIGKTKQIYAVLQEELTQLRWKN
jgi:hypothetical protein